MKANHIVLTSIYEPRMLFDLQQNIALHGHLESSKCWVVGDRKTPLDCATVCREVSAMGLETCYLDIAAQDEWGRRFPALYKRIPYNNETRRNIGYLHALEQECERLISVDDDNFPSTDNFIGNHSNTGGPCKGKTLSEPSGYHNICEYLQVKPDRLIFPRGYPFKLRGGRNSPTVSPAPENARIGVTSGLWLMEPDIDATTWLNGKVTSESYRGPAQIILDQRTWCPVNTQNTSVTRELIPAYLCIPMGYSVPGGSIERYGDIWGGYFLQALIVDTPYHICFGHPIVEHRRNPHSYLDDLRHEFWGMLLTDWLTEQLRTEFMPAGQSIVERMKELSSFLFETSTGNLPSWCPTEVYDFIRETSKTMHLWAATCQTLLR